MKTIQEKAKNYYKRFHQTFNTHPIALLIMYYISMHEGIITNKKNKKPLIYIYIVQ